MKKNKSTVNKAGNYTKPTMRKNLFNRIKSGTSGGGMMKAASKKKMMRGGMAKKKK